MLFYNAWVNINIADIKCKKFRLVKKKIWHGVKQWALSYHVLTSQWKNKIYDKQESNKILIREKSHIPNSTHFIDGNEPLFWQML